MGRPSRGEKRADKWLQVRLTAEEHDEVKRRAEAAGLSVSELARRLLLGPAPSEAQPES